MMVWGVVSRTYPEGTLVSTTTIVLPGTRPVTVTVPSLPKDKVSGNLISGAQFQVTYANGGYVDNDPSTTLKATPDSGSFSVPSMNFRIIRVVPGSLSKVRLLATPERTTIFFGVSRRTPPGHPHQGRPSPTADILE